jgi:HD superfamily phosphodiesterase
MNKPDIYTSAENKWLRSLTVSLEGIFGEEVIHSHDDTHHLRVWGYGKELLMALEAAGNPVRATDAENLLITCMLHDAGLSTTTDKEHGKAGAIIAGKLLSEAGWQAKEMEPILYAIEHHEDKSYLKNRRLYDQGELQLLTALNIADDLDAMGKAGVYRYAEIYLMRGIAMEDLGLQIISNLSTRYGNFMKHCGRLPAMVMKHSPRHHATETFFRNYNYQLRKITAGDNTAEGGPVGVIRIIYRFVLSGNTFINELFGSARQNPDPFVQNFFKELQDELQVSR